ncbi:MAG: S8 family serine peptidase [Woeseiaceae bacterium]|nr:S8 family serine peptidase [Woeseiaceae bacterium]
MPMRFRTLLLLALATGAWANDSNLSELPAAAPVRLDGPDSAAESKVYIVQLSLPSAVQQHARAAARAPKPAKGERRQRFDKFSAVARNDVAKIVAEQESVLAKAGPGVQPVYSYRYSFNGFAARMTAAQADKLENLPEVLQVWEDEIRPLATNFSAEFLGLFEPGEGLRVAPGLDGDGIVIGFIDSGIAPGHPALSDTREADRPRACRSSWAENTLLGRWLCTYYRRQEDVLEFDEPEDWNGVCQGGDQFEESDCNNKVIGARWYAEGATNSGLIDPGEIFSPRDVDGHGTHTATTAAGNRVTASIFGTRIGRIEGIAPKARVAVYKACWLRPNDSRASCNTSDLASAIDAAVADGVDIINYSVGSSQRRITAPDDIALMAAAKAGVLSVVAAGNEGPGLATIGSPAGGPWVITTAASSRAGDYSVEAMRIDTPESLAGLYAVREANFTPSLREEGPIEGRLVLVDDADDSGSTDGPGTVSDACQSIVNSDEVSGEIAFIQRGGCDFDIKVANAASAGAVAALVYNIAGDPIVMWGDAGTNDVPALMMGQADANLILAEFDAGNDVTVTLDKDLLLTRTDVGDLMGSFSSRGAGPIPDILKPDVTAPGINILAGFTPDAVNAMSGENYAYLSGTSMATPHVSGVAALLMQEHPDWSPAAIKSALMTTARRDVTAADGESPAIPFDFGAGHIVPNDAIDPGLIYDMTPDDYDAFACAVGLSAVPTATCDALQAAGAALDTGNTNQPSISMSRIVSERTVTRTVSNPGNESRSFTAAVEAPSGMQVTVNPPAITVPAGGSASFDVTMQYQGGPLDLWRFGSLTWQAEDRSVFSTLAAQPVSVSAPAEITTLGESGSFELPVEFGYAGSYEARVHGLALPIVINGFVDNDPIKTFTVRNGNGVTQHVISVPAGQLYLRFAMFDALTDGNDDLDMYIYYSSDNVNWVKVGESGGPTAEERFDYFQPPEGFYAVLVHGYETDQLAGGPGASYQLLGWSFGIDDDRGNLSADGPSIVNAGTTENVAVSWSGLVSNTIYFGAISHNTPQGVSALTLITIGN